MRDYQLYSVILEWSTGHQSRSRNCSWHCERSTTCAKFHKCTEKIDMQMHLCFLKNFLPDTVWYKELFSTGNFVSNLKSRFRVNTSFFMNTISICREISYLYIYMIFKINIFLLYINEFSFTGNFPVVNCDSSRRKLIHKGRANCV